jgi:P4 family phage/plasmid primase-like protien
MIPPPLLTFHRHQLHASAIADDVAAERRYQSVSRPTPGDSSPRDLLKRCGIPGWARNDDARYPGLLIPLYRATGELTGWQYRPDNPSRDPRTGKPRKYACQAGRASVLDVHPRNRDKIIDPSVTLWITEGTKKADSLTSVGACVVALSGVFCWRSRLGTLGDWEDVPLKGRRVIVCFDADAATNSNVARAMARLGKWLKSKAAEPRFVVVPAEISGTATKGADDYLAAGGTLDGLLSVATTSPPDPQSFEAPFSDAVMAETVADEVLDGRYCWAAGLGWLGWDGARWAAVTEASVVEEARTWALARFAALGEAAKQGKIPPKVEVDGWHSMLAASRLRTVVRLAQGIAERDPAGFDAHPDLLNTPSGVVDLRTGALGPHDPDLLLTKITRARYVPGARHRDWAKALEAVPGDVRGWLQLRLGQALTGYPPPDDLVIFNVGGGENGKTTCMFAVRAALGGYAVLVPDRLLSPEHVRQHPTELTDLRGARLAVLEELPEERRLSMQRIKTLTAPQITARRTHENDVTWDSTHALIVSTNHVPLVAETDHGSWRRMAMIRWPYTYWKAHEYPADPGPRDQRAEPGLRERVRGGGNGRAEAVLAWLVDGAQQWYAGATAREPESMGGTPVRVRRDTAGWRAQANPVFRFVAERLKPDGQSHIRADDLATQFEIFLEAEGHVRPSRQVIGARFEEACRALRWGIGEKRKTRRGPGLSSPAGMFRSMADVPASYQAWHGVCWTDGHSDVRGSRSSNSKPNSPIEVASREVCFPLGTSGTRSNRVNFGDLLREPGLTDDDY